MIHFEDMIVGQSMTSPTVVVDRDELVDFAERWDPLAIHVETRPSTSKPDRGIVTVRLSLVRSDGDVVMSHFDTILVRRRVPLD